MCMQMHVPNSLRNIPKRIKGKGDGMTLSNNNADKLGTLLVFVLESSVSFSDIGWKVVVYWVQLVMVTSYRGITT